MGAAGEKRELGSRTANEAGALRRVASGGLTMVGLGRKFGELYFGCFFPRVMSKSFRGGSAR
jgi:hypothetical protein